MNTIKVELTDEEWMSVISQDRDGLPSCCANISALRDAIISMARNDGEYQSFFMVQTLSPFYWATSSHDFEDDSVVMKILNQILDQDEEAQKFWEKANKERTRQREH